MPQLSSWYRTPEWVGGQLLAGWLPASQGSQNNPTSLATEAAGVYKFPRGYAAST